jgi:hypothetical protein
MAEELEMLKELALLADFGHCHGNRKEPGPYKVCLFPLPFTQHQDLGRSTSTLHYRTEEIEDGLYTIEREKFITQDQRRGQKTLQEPYQTKPVS